VVVAPSMVSLAFQSIVTVFTLLSIFLILYILQVAQEEAGSVIVRFAQVASTKIL